MSIWQILGKLLLAIGLTEVLEGKDVTTPEGTILGTVSDIEMDLKEDKIWVIIHSQGEWNRIPIKQIVSLTDKVTLFEGWLPTCTERRAGVLM